MKTHGAGLSPSAIAQVAQDLKRDGYAVVTTTAATEQEAVALGQDVLGAIEGAGQSRVVWGPRR